MKRFLALALLVVMVATLFVGCGGGKEKFKCDACQQEVESTKHHVEMFGVGMDVCDACKKEYDEAMGALGDLDVGDVDLGDIDLGDLDF